MKSYHNYRFAMHDVLKMPLMVLLKNSKGPHESVSKTRLAGTWAFIDAFIKRDSSLFIGLDWIVEFQSFRVSASVSVCKNPTIYNIICWFAGPMGQTTLRPNV